MNKIIEYVESKSQSVSWRLQSWRNNRSARLQMRENENNPNMIFVWVPKNAGTSLCNKFESLGGQRLNRDYLIGNYFCNRGFVTFGHYSLQQLRAEGVVSDDYFESAFKFAVVRNPFDRAVSLYEYLSGLRQFPRSMSFRSFCEALGRGEYEPIGLYSYKGLSQLNPQSTWLCDKSGDVFVDYLARFESLDEDMGCVFERLGAAATSGEVPQINQSSRGKCFDYYTEYEADLVRKAYSVDFKNFNYSYEVPQ